MLTRDRKFYRTFAVLCTMLMLEQAVILSVNLADNIMLGAYNETSLAGVAAVNQIQFVLQQVVYAVSNGMIILGSQYWGQSRTAEIRKLSSIAMRVSLLIVVALFAAVTLFPREMVGLFTPNEAFIDEGVRYLEIIRYTYLFFGASAILMGTMRVAESVRIALVVSVISLLLNCAINYVLIFGNFGAPEMGVRGAALGTLIARTVEMRHLHRLRVPPRPARPAAPARSAARGPRHVRRLPARRRAGHPHAGAVGTVQRPADGDPRAHERHRHRRAVDLVDPLPAAQGHVGRSRFRRVDHHRQDHRRRPRHGAHPRILAHAAGAVRRHRAGARHGAVPHPHPQLRVYNIAAETRALANAYMIIQSIVLVTMSYQMPVNGGIIRGGGDTKFIMVVDLVSIWGIVLPLSYLAAFVWNLSPVIVIILLNSDQVFKCVPAFLRVNSYKWVRHLTRPQADAAK